jgi:hypothetical protein
MKYFVWFLVVLLLVLHQDNWFWDDPTLVGGFMPITLLYHACLSLAAGFTWYLATIFCWPQELESPPRDARQGGDAA